MKVAAALGGDGKLWFIIQFGQMLLEGNHHKIQNLT